MPASTAAMTLADSSATMRSITSLSWAARRVLTWASAASRSVGWNSIVPSSAFVTVPGIVTSGSGVNSVGVSS